MTKIIRNLKGLSLTIVTSILLIFLGIVYFMLTIWMIKIGANWAGFKSVSGSIIVLTTGIVTAATIIGSAIQH
jgi:hypothetical protein